MIMHYGDNSFQEIISVDSATQLTLSGGGASWSLATYMFPKHSEGNIISNCKFVRTSGTVDILVTLGASYGSTFSDNIVMGGTVKAADMWHASIDNNQIYSRETGNAEPCISIIKSAVGTSITNNHVWARNTTHAIGRSGISVIYQERPPGHVRISGNTIHQFIRGISVNVDSARFVDINNNTCILYTPDDATQSAGINVRAINTDIDFASILDNKIFSAPGSPANAWAHGIQISASPNDVHSCEIGGGVIEGAYNPISISAASGGVFTRPPIVRSFTAEDGNSPLVPTATTPWFQIAGVGGRAAGVGYMPGIFWGQNSPEGVLSAAIGSRAYPRNANGGAIAYGYEKQTGTGNTGWVASGGGGGGSPSGSGTELQYRDGAAFGAAANVNIHGGDLQLDQNASPTAAPADGIKLFGAAAAGRTIPAVINERTQIQTVASDLVKSRRAIWQVAGSATGATVIGFNNFSITGTITARNTSFATAIGKRLRAAMVSAAGAGSLSGHRHTAAYISIGDGGGTPSGGFRFQFDYMTSDALAVSGARMFCGLTTATGAPTNVDPASITNCIGIAQLASSSNLHIVYGGSAAQTPIDLGASFPADTLSADMYDVEFYAPPSSNNTVYYRVSKVGTSTVASGTLTGTAGAALPSATTGLTTNNWRCNNATALAVAYDTGFVISEAFY
jgi:hypothetical protein